MYVYAQLSREELQKALPFTNITGSTHMIAYFVNGCDYVGCSTEHDIRQEIKENRMISICDPEVYRLGEEDKVTRFIEFGQCLLNFLL